MTDTTTERPLLVKILVIIGFSATILLIGWAVFMLIAKGPAIFSSLAERVRNLEQGTSSEVTPSDSEDVSTDEEDEADEIVPEDEGNSEVVATPKPTSPSPTTPTQPPRVPPTPSPSMPPQPTKPVYTFPVSDPNGFTDLKITTLGTGVLEHGVLVFTNKYQSSEENAVRIDIENIGTKTSESWRFTTTLPDGNNYTSPSQAPLKPKEHAVFTITFVMDEDDNSERIVSTVQTSRDTVSSNNATNWKIEAE